MTDWKDEAALRARLGRTGTLLLCAAPDAYDAARALGPEQDVVVAARISALAGADEIHVSAAVADLMGPHVTITGRTSAELKGIPGPVEIVLVDWR